jgi:hypothetical protein
VNDQGTFWINGAPAEFDLVEFMAHPYDVTTRAMRSVLDASAIAPPNMASVGDIHSTAKGSGARYNAGKSPLELIPLTILARYYLQASHLDTTRNQAIEALIYLGDFQARGKAGSLMSVLLALGDGWAECAEVFDYGRAKYAEFNWAKGMAWSVPIACAARHLLAIIKGEAHDLESGKTHRGHAICNIVMLMTYEQTFPEGDDRAPAGYLAPLPAAA